VPQAKVQQPEPKPQPKPEPEEDEEQQAEEEPQQAARPPNGKRRKRDRSARARKDRLRSTAPGAASGQMSSSAPPPPPSRSGWLVPPERAAAFETAAQPPAAQQQPPQHKYPIYVPPDANAGGASWVAPPPPPPPAPAPPAPALRPVTPPAPPPINPIALAPPLTESPQFRGAGLTPATQPSSTPIRLKQDTGKFRQGSFSSHQDTRRHGEPAGRPEMFEPAETSQSESPFPWKIGAAAGVVLVLGIGAAVMFKPGSKTAERPAAAATAPVQAPSPAAEIPSTTGQIAVVTQPAGIRVLLDGKPAGESPVTLQDVSPGRHVVTLLSQTGAVKKTVRVEAGKSVSLDVPIFSGFAAISAPFVVDVTENGRALGTSENQIMLSPGHHELHLANRDLQYSTKQSVDIEPGETKRIELNPEGNIILKEQTWEVVCIYVM
jgi:hypothetical protein